MERLSKLTNAQRAIRHVFIKCVPILIDSAVYPVLFHGPGLVLIRIRIEVDNELAAGCTH